MRNFISRPSSIPLDVLKPWIYVGFVFCAIFLQTAPAVAQNKAEQIDALLTKYHNFGLFNGTVLVAEGGEVIYKRAFGHANMEWDIPNTPATKFRIGSVTKQFTATLILQLVEEGKIDLQERITSYIPSYPKAQGDRITIHQLLTHTSGIPSYTGLPNFESEFSRDPYEPDSFLAVFSGLDLEFDPGAEWRYNNSGYFLLGVIIEKVTGKPYDKVLRERILLPLGLDNSGYDHYGEIIERHATGYVKAGGGYEHAAYLDTSIPYAAGMMYSTVEDLYKWDQRLYDNGPFQKPETKALMFTPHAVVAGDSSMHYGYGWFIRTVPVGKDTVKVIEHGGGIPGFITGFWRMPEERHTVIVMDNTTNPKGEEVVRGIVHILYGVPAPEPKQSIADVMREVIDTEGMEAAVARYLKLKANKPDAYDFGESELNRLGYYYLGSGDTDTAIRIFQLNVEAYPEAFNTYDSLGEAYLEAGDRERAIVNYQRALELNPGSQNARAVLKRLGVEVEEEEVNVPDEVLKSYVGKYELQPGFMLTITKEGTQMYAQATGQSRAEIYPSAENKFYMKVVPAQLTFNLNEAGEVESLTLHQDGQEMLAKKVQ